MLTDEGDLQQSYASLIPIANFPVLYNSRNQKETYQILIVMQGRKYRMINKNFNVNWIHVNYRERRAWNSIQRDFHQIPFWDEILVC
jgi:hypothetical protein